MITKDRAIEVAEAISAGIMGIRKRQRVVVQEIIERWERNKEKLKATGVVALFETTAQCPDLRLSNNPLYQLKPRKICGVYWDDVRRKVCDYTPARVYWSVGNNRVTLEFSGKHAEIRIGRDGVPMTVSVPNQVTASFDPEGCLTINDVPVPADGDLGEIVQEEFFRIAQLPSRLPPLEK